VGPQPQDFQLVINGNNTIALDTPYPVTANKANVVSETGSVPGYVATMIQCTSDIPDSRNNLTVPDSGTAGVIPVLAENIDCTITNDDVPTGLTVVKHVQNDDGGNAVVADFPLQVNGAPVTSGQSMSAATGVELAISETQQPGYIATDVTCVSSDPNSANNVKTADPQPAALAIVSLAATESVMCTVTNDDIAPTVTVHKTVVGGTALASDFQMTLAGAPVDQDVPVPANANQSLEVSEVPVAGYDLTSIVCTDDVAGHSAVVHPLVLNEGQNVTCTVTNTFAAPTITIAKAVTNDSGGGLTAADFELTLDGAAVAQGSAIDVQPGAHVVAEVAKPGYAQTGIACKDNATNATVGTAGSVDIAVGQHVTCTVSNDDIPATLKLVKQLIVNNGGVANPAGFQLQIDDANVPQLTAQSLSAGVHTIGEVVVPGWKLTSITCTDDVTKVPVSYSAGITLGLDQHVTCNVFNEDLPIDLAITKTDNGAIEVAGGAPFDYTITVRNLGPGDPAVGAVVTVTDQLPAGFDFVAFPATCTAVGQTLTCPILATDLQVADAPVVFTVGVQAHPDIASGTYTNKAFVDTADDRACVGTGCVPVCGPSDNNVACQDTDIRREASITIDKHDDVGGAITPGTTYNYIITVTNPGPSTFLGDLAMIDDLPLGLSLVSVDGGGQWSCAPVDPVICTFSLNLQPGAKTASITIKVTLDPNFLGTSVFNQATATATVDPPVPPAAALRTQATTGAPGAVVTATDDETTSVVRNSDMAIVKSVSQTTAAPGGEFNWVLDVTNNGPQTATNVVVNDTVPPAFEVVGAFPGSGLNCTNTTSVVQCTAAALASGATVRVTVQVRVVPGAAAGTSTNTATVSSDSVDSDPSNNTSSASIDVSAAASLAPVPPGQTPPANTQLPRTGNDSGEPLRLAGLMFITGALAIYVARRRRSITAQ